MPDTAADQVCGRLATYRCATTAQVDTHLAHLGARLTGATGTTRDTLVNELDLLLDRRAELHT